MSPNDDYDPDWDPDPDPADDITVRSKQLRDAYVLAVRRMYERSTGGPVVGRPSLYNSSPKWDGGYDSRSRRMFVPVWPGIVAKADAKGFDPLYLLRHLFEATNGPTVPTPHQIVSDANVSRAIERGPHEKARAEQAASAELAVFKSAIWANRRSCTDPNPAAPVRTALNDMGRDLSPLFRYCMAVATGHADIATRWRGTALSQLANMPEAYLKTWAHLLPQELVETYTCAHLEAPANGSGK